MIQKPKKNGYPLGGKNTTRGALDQVMGRIITCGPEKRGEIPKGEVVERTFIFVFAVGKGIEG